MLDLILTAGPVFAIMLSPLLMPVLGWTFGKLTDPFRAAPEPGIAERLAERRRTHAEQRGRHLATHEVAPAEVLQPA
jgi:hypothetical protein